MKALLTITVLLLSYSVNAATLSERLPRLLPPVLAEDADLIEVYWRWLLAETEAPEDTPLPPMVVQKLPNNARMGLFYPTQFQRDERLRIALSPRAIARAANGERLLVIAELAHELVHFVLLMKEHHWAFARHRFELARHGHCDTEFKRLSQHISSILWHAYHSDNLTRDVAQMVQKACWEHGEVLSRPGGF